MATQILEPGSAEAASDAITLDDGEVAVLVMSSTSTGPASVQIQVQNADESWTSIMSLGWFNQRAASLAGPLTFRVQRGDLLNGAVAGVERA